MLRSVNLQDFITRDPVTIRPEESVFDAIHKILTYQVSGLSVIDERRNLVGILSEIDCLRAVLSSVYNEAPFAGTVDEYMTKEVISVRITDNIVDVAQDMMKHKHRRRPVVGDDGKLVGQVSCRRLLRAVQEFAGAKGKAKVS